MEKKSSLINIAIIAFWPLLIAVLIVVHKPSFNNYFFGDDFYNLKLIQGKKFFQVLSTFNIFTKSPEDFPFYRPLTTQLFWWLGFKFFKLDPFGYHLFTFSFFLLSLLLVFILTKLLTQNQKISFLTVFFYAFSASHFYRLYFLSQFQEIGLTVFYLLTVIFYLKFNQNQKLVFRLFSLFCFVLSLTSKESAITLPLALFLVYLFKQEKLGFNSFKGAFFSILPFFYLGFVYFFLRLFFFGFAKGGAYQFVFHPKAIANSFIWYFLWSLGVPEDFVNLSLRDPTTFINLKFFSAFGELGAATLSFLAVFFFNLSLGVRVFVKTFLKKKLKTKRFNLFIFACLWFILSLTPVLFFPFHKFTYSTTLSLLGVSLLLALFAEKIFSFSRFYFLTLIFSFLLVSDISHKYAYTSHWSVKRAKQAQKIIAYFQKRFPSIDKRKTYYFHDTSCFYCCQDVAPWSREIAYTLSDGRGLEVYYQKDLKIYFQYSTSMFKAQKERTNFIYSKPFF